MKLVFASGNEHKVKEIRNKLGENFELLSLNDLSITDEIPETSDTLEGNAKLKASYISERLNLNCFADDTGLEIEELGNEPGVLSARYAGEDKDSNKNIQKVLDNLKGKINRNARFRTVICLYFDNEYHFFEGIIRGTISTEKSGVSGFGYDPIFIPEGFDQTFAEMTLEEKNKISHRALAFESMLEFLKRNVKK